MRAEIGDIVTIDEGNKYARALPIGEASGEVISRDYCEDDDEYVYCVRFFITGREWSVAEYEIIKIKQVKEKVIFT